MFLNETVSPKRLMSEIAGIVCIVADLFLFFAILFLWHRFGTVLIVEQLQCPVLHSLIVVQRLLRPRAWILPSRRAIFSRGEFSFVFVFLLIKVELTSVVFRKQRRQEVLDVDRMFSSRSHNQTQ